MGTTCTAPLICRLLTVILAAIDSRGAASAESAVLLDALDSDAISAGGAIPTDALESAIQSMATAVLPDTSDCSACICTGDAADSICDCVAFAGQRPRNCTLLHCYGSFLLRMCIGAICMHHL